MTDAPARSYQVVRNDEDQYSLWPLGPDLPPGWEAGGFTGSEDECLAHIGEVWVDMRPRSVREFGTADEGR